MPGAGKENCEGLYGESCETPLPKYRNRFSTTWTTPVERAREHVVALHRRRRHRSGRCRSGGHRCTATTSTSPAIWNVTDYATLRAGVNNLLDTSPPITDNGITARNNGNTYPGAYDALGQYWFLAATFHM